MVSKGPRESHSHNVEQRRYDEELRQNPPILIWETVPNTCGVRRAVFIKDPPPGKSGRVPRPPCDCNLYGSPRRKPGPHHAETCARNTP